MSSERSDRADGYDWRAVLRFTYSDDTVSEWKLSGTLTRHAQGLDWHTDLSIDRPPPGATAAKVVRSIDARVTHGSNEPKADSGTREATIKMTVTHGDGRQRTSTMTREISAAAAEPSLTDLLNSVRTDSQVDLPFPKRRGDDTNGSLTVHPELPAWFCEESCASGCIEFIETPIGYAACFSVCMGVCLAD